jgi:hypothetical protein
VNILKLTDPPTNENLSSEQILYDYLLESVRTEEPEQVLKRFEYLFIKLESHTETEVNRSLVNIINSKDATYQFDSILNRCCHILINRWQLQSKTQQYIPELIGLFDQVSPIFRGVDIRSFSNRLQQLMINFINGDYYKQLKRLAAIISKNKKNSLQKKENIIDTDKVGNLIDRYPYLYNHCLLSADSSVEQQQTVYKIKNQLQRKFELNLSKYITYQIKAVQADRHPELKREKGKIIQLVSNPTLLKKRDLGRSLKHYVGTVENGRTYKELSSSFVSHIDDVRNYQVFKDELYQYIIQSIDSKYGKHRFNKKLYNKLQNIYPQFDYKKPDEFLKMRTYSQVFNYLIVESPHNPSHVIFMDLVSNMGTTRTIGIFLKIALACNKVKPYLEKRFSILFNHYESFSKDGVNWLVRSLEKLNIALCTNFGNIDLSFLKRIYAKNS